MSSVIRPTQFDALEDFRRWENEFDVSLKNPSPRLAWQTLTRAGCGPDALKFALYWAAYTLKRAYDWPQEFAAFSEAREATLQQLGELQRTLRALIAPTIEGNSLVSRLFVLYGVVEKHSRFFQDFPKMVERIESILTFVKPLGTRKHTDTFSEIARGEVLLHLYVEETTGKFFDKETAVLLEASAESYSMKHMPKYSTEAVIKRYRRWFRERKNSDYRELQKLVKEIARDGDEFPTNFLENRTITGSLLRHTSAMISMLMDVDRGRALRVSKVGDPLALLNRGSSVRRFSSSKRS